MTARKKTKPAKVPRGTSGKASAIIESALKAQQKDQIAVAIGSGVPLAEICRREGMPGLRTVYDWMEVDGEFAARIARAREAGYDHIAQEALRIADTPMEGKRIKIGKDGTEEEWTEDMLGHRKLQVETRLKLLAKWDPKRYGDKVQTELTGADGGPIKTEGVVSVALDPFEAYRLMKSGGRLEKAE